MVGPAAVALLLLVPAAPVPAGPPPAAPARPVDPAKTAEFGSLVYTAAMNVATRRRDVELADLAAAAVRGMYETAGRPVPADLLHTLRDAKRHEERMEAIGDARGRLAGCDALRGPRAYLAAVHGFRHAFDPLAGLAPLRGRTTLSTDMDFNLGFELEGVDGPRATLYRVERLIAAGQAPRTGLLDAPPPPDAVPAPAAYPWRVRRVVPGGPAHRAGLKAGDTVTRLNGAAVTPADADRLFARLAFPLESDPDPKTGVVRPARIELEVRRGSTDVRVAMVTEEFVPTNVAGAVLRPNDTWDGMLDPAFGIGYVRVGAVENRTDLAVGAVMADLAGRGCRGLVLDLRWCPGGWVTPGANVAAMFLPPDAVVARVEFPPNLAPPDPDAAVNRGTWAGPRHPTLPLAVLVGGETLGGGELIAAALQEQGRAAVFGQRTPGRAATLQVMDVGFAGLGFKATFGTTLRPSGKPRHRTPGSGPADDWGIRPDPGREVPLTPAAAAELRGWAEAHALRPPGDRTALPFDDPDRDPVRAAALADLRKHLGPPAAQN